MICRSKKNNLLNNWQGFGFTLIETMVALVILALISGSVLVVVDRCTASVADTEMKMHAFEIARDNMEKLLSLDAVEETVEYGSSDIYPEIEWQTTVESFYEPITSRMWIQAVCSAEYPDSEGETQTVELTHWLTDLTEQQILAMMENKDANDLDEDLILKTIEEAAEYADVDVDTIQEWVDNGMPVTEEGYYIKGQLDLFKETDGKPTEEQITVKQQEIDEEITNPPVDPSGPEDEQKKPVPDDGRKRIGGRTLEEWIAAGFPRKLLEPLFDNLE